MSSIDLEKMLDSRVGYAWNWFSYHAGQRMTAINFFLIAVGAMIVAYTTAATQHLKGLGVGVSALSVFICAAFRAIDARNAQIVGIARSELARLEPKFDVNITRKAEKERKRWKSHGFWLPALVIVIGIVSLFALVWAARGYGHHKP
jgi:hypothetical protein